MRTSIPEELTHSGKVHRDVSGITQLVFCPICELKSERKQARKPVKCGYSRAASCPDVLVVQYMQINIYK
jgi:hypothetical protein